MSYFFQILKYFHLTNTDIFPKTQQIVKNSLIFNFLFRFLNPHNPQTIFLLNFLSKLLWFLFTSSSSKIHSTLQSLVRIHLLSRIFFHIFESRFIYIQYIFFKTNLMFHKHLCMQYCFF